MSDNRDAESKEGLKEAHENFVAGAIALIANCQKLVQEATRTQAFEAALQANQQAGSLVAALHAARIKYALQMVEAPPSPLEEDPDLDEDLG